jgi:protein-L-isoaspartate(D-aspartate) O-methyltransferase
MTVQVPIPDYAAARAAMIESQLRPQGVTDPAVLAAMGSLPREQFVPDHARPLAYSDRSVPLGDGRYLVPPAVLGQLLTQMSLEHGQRALVVGAGTGYSAALLGAMGLEVHALESAIALVARARELGVEAIEGPLGSGLKSEGPYDQILIDGAVESIPDALVDQLADGGCLAAALIDRGVARLIVGRKAGSAFGYFSVGDAGVPVLPGFSRPKAFTL